jgi:hypothetical protein
MYLTRILLSIVFVFFASTALAAPPEKTLLCHVGNEVGPGGEDYFDDPGCVPHDDNDWFCPDAGKIDLIEVAKPAKHLANAAHSYDGISDYLPGDIGASGLGDEDSNGDGVDDGCEPPVRLACPCWSSYTESEVVAAMNGAGLALTCLVVDNPPDFGLAIASGVGSTLEAEYSAFASIDNSCQNIGGFLPPDNAIDDMSYTEAVACFAELVAIIPQITWCSD